MRPKEGPQLADKPSELRAGLQNQNSPPTPRTVILKFMQAAEAAILEGMDVRYSNGLKTHRLYLPVSGAGLIGRLCRSVEETIPRTLSRHLWLCVPPRSLSARSP